MARKEWAREVGDILSLAISALDLMGEHFVPNRSRSPIDELIQIYAYRHLTSEIIDMRKKCGCVAANKNYSQKPYNKTRQTYSHQETNGRYLAVTWLHTFCRLL